MAKPKGYTAEPVILKFPKAEVLLSQGQTVKHICRVLEVSDWCTGLIRFPNSENNTASTSVAHTCRVISSPQPYKFSIGIIVGLVTALYL